MEKSGTGLDFFNQNVYNKRVEAKKGRVLNAPFLNIKEIRYDLYRALPCPLA